MKPYLTILLVCALCGCGHKERVEEIPHSVYVTEPGGERAESHKTFTGIVEENENVSLGFKTAGQIRRILVKEGDHVRNGQLLAELDDSDYRLGVEALQVQYDQLGKEVERTKRLYEKKSVSGNDYEKAVAGLRQLGVQLQVNKNKLAYTRLYAPSAGIIESVNYSPAEMVDAGTPLFNMLASGGLEVVCDIPARTFMEKDNFSEITCRSSHGDDELPLRLVSIVPKADNNQLYRMRLALESGNPAKVTSGMNVEVTIKTEGDAEDTMTLPESSVFRHGDDICVWIVRPDSTVTLRRITVKPEITGSKVTVTGGLDPADKVVRAGVSALHEGDKVKIIGQPGKTNVGGIL